MIDLIERQAVIDLLQNESVERTITSSGITDRRIAEIDVDKLYALPIVNQETTVIQNGVNNQMIESVEVLNL